MPEMSEADKKQLSAFNDILSNYKDDKKIKEIAKSRRTPLVERKKPILKESEAKKEQVMTA